MQTFFQEKYRNMLLQNSSYFAQALTHCGPVTPYDAINPGQHWLRQWLDAWWHQAITWTNVD